jgi:hypothetical protein
LTLRGTAVALACLAAAACGRVDVAKPDAAAPAEGGAAGTSSGDAAEDGTGTGNTSGGAGTTGGGGTTGAAGAAGGDASIDGDGDGDAAADGGVADGVDGAGAAPEVGPRRNFPCQDVVDDRWTYYLGTDTSPWHVIASHFTFVANEPATRQLRLTNGDVVQRDALRGSYFFEFDMVMEGALAFVVGFPGSHGYLPSVYRGPADIFLTGFDYDLQEAGSVGAFQGQYFTPRPLHVTAFVKATARSVALRVDLPTGATYRSGFIPVAGKGDGGVVPDLATPRLMGGDLLQADHPARLSTLVGCQRLSDAEIDMAYAL